ncbi:MAG: hypothetical protein V3W06_07960 [Acidimicrobiia bacterium]
MRFATWRLLAVIIVGWINQHQLTIIEYEKGRDHQSCAHKCALNSRQIPGSQSAVS